MNKLFGASLAGLGLLAAGCGLGADDIVVTPDANREVIIDMSEFSFGVDVIEVTQGETVTFVLLNVGDNEHEFMIGRDLVETEEGYPNGFEHDFFETTEPMVEPASAGMDMGAMDMDGMDMDGMDMGDEDDDMAGMDMGDDDSDDDHADDDGSDDHGDDGMAGMDMDGMDHAGFMVQRRPGEVARLTVTIPDDVLGVWEIGCFRGRGSHWDAGMNATLVVLEA